MMTLTTPRALSALLVLAAVGAGPAAAAAPPAPGTPVDVLARRLDTLARPGGLTAADAGRRAAEIAPAVKRKAATVTERDAATTATELQRVPTVAATLSYTRLSEVDMPELAPGVTIPQVLDNWVIRLELSIPLTDYLLRFPALVSASELRARAARADVDAAEAQAAAQGREAYWQWVRASLRVAVAEQSLAQVQATVAQMEARVEAQRASKADLLRLKAQAAEARRGVIVAQEAAALAERQLRQLIGAGPDEALAIGEDVLAAPAAPAALDAPVGDLVTRALGQRSETKTLDLAIAALDASDDATEAGLWPRLDAFASVDYDNPNSRVFLGGERFDATWMAGVRLSWRLGDALAVAPQQDQLRAQVIALRADKENLARQLELAIADALRAVRVAVATRETTTEAEAAAEEGYRIRAELLANDRATAVELVDAETELTRTRFQEVDALIDLRVALSNLAYALGEEVQ
ncbi:MAG: TolC family protein [Deltaproteobacteria bacterium]|nr:TolC family protein [Deltaproteobacteria bacterium]